LQLQAMASKVRKGMQSAVKRRCRTAKTGEPSSTHIAARSLSNPKSHVSAARRRCAARHAEGLCVLLLMCHVPSAHAGTTVATADGGPLIRDSMTAHRPQSARAIAAGLALATLISSNHSRGFRLLRRGRRRWRGPHIQQRARRARMQSCHGHTPNEVTMVDLHMAST
jgi:hypothetical protein